MPNRIRSVRVWTQRAVPAEAAISILVELEQLTSTTQIRGRLIGPRCRYSSTVEVAYPLREWVRERHAQKPHPHIGLRVVIPEACFWDPDSPFLYQGPIELWQDGELCAQTEITHAMRSLAMTGGSLYVNGRLFTIRAAERSSASEAELLALHEVGCNTLVASLASAAETLWHQADQLGFFVLAKLDDLQELLRTSDLSDHVSCLGSVMAGDMPHDLRAAGVLPNHLKWSARLAGLDCAALSSGPFPAGFDFAVCRGRELAQGKRPAIPFVIQEDTSFPMDGSAWELTSRDSILGWVYS
jgi:hypothetical protein